jgi:hypothetical protein
MFDHQHSTKVKIKQHHKWQVLFINDLVPLVVRKYLNAGDLVKTHQIQT